MAELQDADFATALYGAALLGDRATAAVKEQLVSCVFSQQPVQKLETLLGPYRARRVLRRWHQLRAVNGIPATELLAHATKFGIGGTASCCRLTKFARQRCFLEPPVAQACALVALVHPRPGKVLEAALHAIISQELIGLFERLALALQEAPDPHRPVETSYSKATKKCAIHT